MIRVMSMSECLGNSSNKFILFTPYNFKYPALILDSYILSSRLKLIFLHTHREILQQFIGYNLNEHQLISLIRQYRTKDKISPTLPTAVLFSVLQGELKRINFLNFEALLKGLEEAIKVTDDFGRAASSIARTLENIKDPEQVEKAIQEDIDKIKVLNK